MNQILDAFNRWMVDKWKEMSNDRHFPAINNQQQTINPYVKEPSSFQRNESITRFFEGKKFRRNCREVFKTGILCSFQNQTVLLAALGRIVLEGLEKEIREKRIALARERKIAAAIR